MTSSQSSQGSSPTFQVRATWVRWSCWSSSWVRKSICKSMDIIKGLAQRSIWAHFGFAKISLEGIPVFFGWLHTEGLQDGLYTPTAPIFPALSPCIIPSHTADLCSALLLCLLSSYCFSVCFVSTQLTKCKIVFNKSKRKKWMGEPFNAYFGQRGSWVEETQRSIWKEAEVATQTRLPPLSTAGMWNPQYPPIIPYKDFHKSIQIS